MVLRIYCERPVHEVFEENRYYFSVLHKGLYELEELPKLVEVPTDKNWILARNYDGKPIGIKTIDAYPYIIDGGFHHLTKDYEAEIFDGFDDYGRIKTHRIYSLVHSLTPEEVEWAQNKFRELLLAEQEDLLEQRSRACEIMVGDLD